MIRRDPTVRTNTITEYMHICINGPLRARMRSALVKILRMFSLAVWNLSDS